MSVDVLRKKLADLEAEGRFGGRAYPQGMEPFPRVLSGQGFFPGGDGLWRDPDRESLRRSSSYAFPVGGIMFLGNDFGVQETFEAYKSHENTWTWQWLRKRIAYAEQAFAELGFAEPLGPLGFYTNAFLGLRSVPPPTGKRPLENPSDEKDYDDLCAEYLEFQLRTQRPKLVVVLGADPAGPVKLLGRVIDLSDYQFGQTQTARFEEERLWVLQVSHPHSDQFNPDQRAKEGARLAVAWLKVQESDPTA